MSTSRFRKPWPEALSEAPFTATEAAEQGVSRRRRDAKAVERPAYSVRTLSPVESPRQLSLVIARTLPPHIGPDGFAFSHLTAVRLFGWPWSADWTVGEPVHITTNTANGRIRRAGVIGHRGLECRKTDTVKGIPVTDPADTWGDLAVLPGVGVDDLVIIGDVILVRSDDDALDKLREVVDRRENQRGVTRLREALTLVRKGSASPMESLTRVGFARAALPEPELNVDVTDEHGQWLGKVDFLWREPRVFAEYQGAHHADPKQQQLDVRRQICLENADWTYVPITASTVFKPVEWEELLVRLRSLLT